MPYVNHRWLGGMLTNFQTIHKRILYMLELEQMEQAARWNRSRRRSASACRRELVKLQAVLGGFATSRPPDASSSWTSTPSTSRCRGEPPRHPGDCLVDTNCDPDIVDIVIPGNDDAIRAAQLIAGVVADGCIAGREIAEASEGQQGGRVRSEEAKE